MKGDMDALMELVFDDDEFVVPTGPAGGEEEVDGRVVPGGGEAGS